MSGFQNRCKLLYISGAAQALQGAAVGSGLGIHGYIGGQSETDIRDSLVRHYIANQ